MMSSILCSSPAQVVNILHQIIVQLSLVLDIPKAEVDIASSFIQLGGHSLHAYVFQKACAKRGIELSIASILRCQSIEALCENVTATEIVDLDFKKYALCETRKRTRSEQCDDDVNLTSVKQLPSAKRRAIKSIKEISWTSVDTDQEVDLTEMQLALLFGSIAKPGTNIISFYETYKSSDLSSVRDAWQHVIKSEPIFRSRLEMVGGKGKLIQSQETMCEWTEAIVVEEDVYKRLVGENPTSLLLTNSFRVVTIEAEDSKGLSTIIWSFHHGLMDGYSAHLIYKKFRTVLADQQIRSSPRLQHIVSKLKALQDLSRTNDRQFWQCRVNKSQLEPPKILLPTSGMDLMPSVTSTSSLTGQAQAERLLYQAQRVNVSSASIYHAAWALTLSAFTNSENPCFGAVFSGRNFAVKNIEHTIGLFINALPLSVDVSKTHNTHAFLQEVFQSMLDLSNVQSSRPDDGFTRNFDSLLSIQFSMKPKITDKGPRPVNSSGFRIVGDIPINVCIWEDGSIVLNYHSHRYERDDMENLLQYFLNAIKLLTGPNSHLNSVMRNLMPVTVRNLVMQQSNATSNQTCAQSISEDVVTMFEAMARSYASFPALQKGDEVLSYKELDRRASFVATHLQDMVMPEEVVCIHADRSLNWIIGIYAVLKVGAVYSALDPLLPSVIRDSNFRITNAKTFLATSNSAKETAPEDSANVLSIEELLQTPLPADSSVLPHRSFARPSDNAYVCFTSGSTGQPKGVICTHAGLVAFHKDEERRMYAAPGLRIGQSMSPAFDGSIHEIFSTLSYGATLVLSDANDPFAHLSSVHSACLTPSIASVLDPDDYPILDNLYLVGEPLSQQVSDIWSARKRLYNMYGPTECTCGATTQRMSPQQPVTIGPPNTSVRVYIVDHHGNLCPPRVTGEICLAGVQVARGYIGRPQETRKKFVTDPFFGDNREMMYHTGDRGFINKAGQVECLGRNDRLVKLRGFRLDLNDLETRVVNGLDEVKATVVATKGSNLVAMVQPASLDVADLRLKMAEVLPPYAMPRDIIAVDEFPRTQIGKLDYKAMSGLFDNKQAPSSPTLNLLTPSEHTVARIWSEVLGTPIDQLNATSCFQSMGGHSILQLLLVERLRETFSVDIPLLNVIQSTTLRTLARDIDVLKDGADSDCSQLTGSLDIKPLGRNVLSPLELDWWHRYQHAGTLSTSFTVTHAASLDSTIVDIDRLAEAWNLVIDRHEMLRSRYARSADGHVSRVYACRGTTVYRADQFDLHKEINQPFDLSTESPIRVIMSQTTILVSISHIICDYTALSVLLQEVACIYNNKSLSSVESHFSETTAWSIPVSDHKLNFWKSRLQNLPPSLFPPRDSFAGKSHVFEIRPRVYQSITDFSDKNGFTLHQISLAAVALVLTFNTEEVDIILGGPFLNRGNKDLNTFGNFVEPLPIPITHIEGGSSDNNDAGMRVSNPSFLHTVQSSSRDAIDNAINWSHIVSLLPADHKPSLPNYPLIEAMVTVHDERTMRKLSASDIPGATPVNTWTVGAKFKLMFEFRAVMGMPFMMRIESDDSVVGGEDKVRKMAGLMEIAFEALVKGFSVAEIKKSMRALVAGCERTCEDLSDQYFGAPMVS